MVGLNSSTACPSLSSLTPLPSPLPLCSPSSLSPYPSPVGMVGLNSSTACPSGNICGYGTTLETQVAHLTPAGGYSPPETTASFQV